MTHNKLTLGLVLPELHKVYFENFSFEMVLLNLSPRFLCLTCPWSTLS